jgi:hypothetical protein
MKIVIITCLLILSISIKVSKVSQLDPKIFDIMTSPNTIRELFHAIKSSRVDGGAGVKECYDLIFKSKYETPMTQFWDNVGKVCVNENQNIPRDFFITLVNSQDEAVKIEGIEKKCKDIIIGNMLTSDEVQNPTKQNELKRIMEPFFSTPTRNVNLNQKNIITAFIGVHRNTPQSDRLISKLNKN